MGKRRRVLALLVTTVAIIGVACSTPSPKAGHSVGVEGGTIVLSDTVSVVVPAGAATDGTEFATRGEHGGPDAVDDVTETNGFADIAVLAGSITSPVTVEFAAVGPVSGDQVAVVGLHETSDAWELLPATYDPARGVVAVQTSSFSPIGFAIVTPTQVRDAARDLVEGFFDGVAFDVEAPSCEGEDAVREEGWAVTSSSSDRVQWCLGRDGDRIVLRVTNSSRYPRVFRTVNADQVVPPTGGFATAFSEWVGHGDDVVAEPGGELRVYPSPSQGTRTTVRSEYDGLAASVFQLQFGIDLAAVFLTKFGLSETKASQLTEAAVTSSGCLDASLPPLAAGDLGPSDFGEIIRACVVPAATDLIGGPVAAVLGSLFSVVVAGLNWASSNIDYVTNIQRDNYKVTVTSPGPICDPALMWEAASQALRLNADDPNYADMIRHGEGPGVWGQRCFGEWAFGGVSRPTTGLTDASDVFRWSDGRWAYAGDAGVPITRCTLEDLGMDAATIEGLFPGADLYGAQYGCPDPALAAPPPPATGGWSCTSTQADIAELVSRWAGEMGERAVYGDHPEFAELGRPAVADLVATCGKPWAIEVANNITGTTFRAMDAIVSSM